MTFGNIGLALALGLGMAAATLGSVAQAGDHREASKAHRRAAAGMQAVAVSPKAGDPAHGWRYFSDARAIRAVVISPNGEYFYSRGEGLQLVFRPTTAG